jgi:predicted peptidase
MRLQLSRFVGGLVLCMLVTSCMHSTNVQQLVPHAQPLADTTIAEADTGLFESGQFIAPNGTVLPYRLLHPAHVEADQRYPLVLHLHGAGEIGNDNQKQLDRIARSWAMPDIRIHYPTYVLVPQFPTRSANYSTVGGERISEASPVLRAAMDLLEQMTSQHAVDTSRIYAVGFSMGASSTWHAPLLEPTRFAAIVPVAGVAPDIQHASALHALPILILHGNADEVNSIHSSQHFLAALQKAGHHHVALREYDGLGHQPASDLYPGHWWRRWLFQQRTPTLGK